MPDQCPRCRTRVVHDANYCHACGVSLTAAVTGEYELYDVERFFHYALFEETLLSLKGYAASLALLLGLAALGHAQARKRQMREQYGWRQGHGRA